MGNKPKVLIIGDGMDFAEATKVVLENKQYELIIAQSGKEGIEKVGIEKPDIIILDIMMETGDKGFDYFWS